MSTAVTEALWTAILKCRDCGHELNRAENVPTDQKGFVSVTSALAAPRCPKGCRSTLSDLNLNTTIEWMLQS